MGADGEHPVQSGAGVERPRRLLQKLLLPRINLVRMHLLALRQIAHRRLFPHRLSAIFAFNAASIFRLVFVIMPSVYQTERPFSNLASGPEIGVHFTILLETQLSPDGDSYSPFLP